MVAKRKKPRPIIGVGSPAIIKLDAFGDWVFHAFGTMPYLVGSSTKGKVWRDVDVRLMLPDDEYAALFGEPRSANHYSAKWALVCAGISQLASDQTGLPIDFQIQQQSDANAKYPNGVRYPLGVQGIAQPPTKAKRKSRGR